MINTKTKEYKSLRCKCCDWRLCDVPIKMNLETIPCSLQEMEMKNMHLILKCKRCKSKNIIIIK